MSNKRVRSPDFNALEESTLDMIVREYADVLKNSKLKLIRTQTMYFENEDKRSREKHEMERTIYELKKKKLEMENERSQEKYEMERTHYELKKKKLELEIEKLEKL